MLWPGIKRIGKELRLKRTDSEVVGTIKNCFVKLYDGRNKKVLELFVPEINQSDKDYISDKLKTYEIKQYEWMEYGVKIFFAEYIRPYSINKIKTILLDFKDYFESQYPNQYPHCEKCGISKELKAYSIDNISWIICEDCYESFENEIKNINAEDTHVPTNYLSGFIGFLLFSIPGILITILLFLFDRLAAISSISYVLLGTIGYKKFKGKTTQFGALIIILSTFLMIVLGIIVSYSVLIIKEMQTIDFDMLLYFFKMPEIWQDVIKNIALSFILSGFYLFFQFIQMMKEWKTKKEIKNAREI